MVSKATVDILGNLDAAFPRSVSKAQDSLAKLRKEQRADIAESNRLKLVLKNLEKGTVQYENTLKKLSKVDANIGQKEDELSKLSKAQAGANDSAGGLSGTIQKLTGGFRSMGPAGIAAGAAIGVVTGAAILAHKALSGLTDEAERLDKIEFRGFDVDRFQQTSRALATITGDFKSGEAAIQGITQQLRTFQESQRIDPSAIRPYLLGLGRLGISAEELRNADPSDVIERLVQGTKNLIRETDVATASGALARAGYGAQADVILELAQDTKALADFRRELNKDPILTAKEREDAKAYGQAMNRVNDSANRVKTTFITAFAPSFERLANSAVPILEKIAMFIEENQELIPQAVEVANKLGVVRYYFQILKQPIDTVLNAVDALRAGWAIMTGDFDKGGKLLLRILIRTAEGGLNLIAPLIKGIDALIAQINRIPGISIPEVGDSIAEIEGYLKQKKSEINASIAGDVTPVIRGQTQARNPDVLSGNFVSAGIASPTTSGVSSTSTVNQDNRAYTFQVTVNDATDPEKVGQIVVEKINENLGTPQFGGA